MNLDGPDFLSTSVVDIDRCHLLSANYIDLERLVCLIRPGDNRERVVGTHEEHRLRSGNIAIRVEYLLVRLATGQEIQ